MRIIRTILVVASIIGSSIPLANANYAERSEVKMMVKRLAAKGLDPQKGTGINVGSEAIRFRDKRDESSSREEEVEGLSFYLFEATASAGGKKLLPEA